MLRKTGLADSAAPLSSRNLPLAYLADAAAAAAAGVPTFTLICFGLASSRFGMLNVSTPF
jgi:hypothetical protein